MAPLFTPISIYADPGKFVDGFSAGLRDRLAEIEAEQKIRNREFDNDLRMRDESRRSNEEGRRQTMFDERTGASRPDAAAASSFEKLSAEQRNIVELATREGARRGYSTMAVGGILGNLMQESRLQANGPRGDGGTAYGLAQWRNERFTGLRSHAKNMGMDWTDPRAQVSWLYTELESPTYSKARQGLMSATNAVQAADAFALHYERPAGAQTGNANNIHGIANRRSWALGGLAAADGIILANPSYASRVAREGGVNTGAPAPSTAFAPVPNAATTAQQSAPPAAGAPDDAGYELPDASAVINRAVRQQSAASASDVNQYGSPVFPDNTLMSRMPDPSEFAPDSPSQRLRRALDAAPPPRSADPFFDLTQMNSNFALQGLPDDRYDTGMGMGN